MKLTLQILSLMFIFCALTIGSSILSVLAQYCFAVVMLMALICIVSYGCGKFFCHGLITGLLVIPSLFGLMAKFLFDKINFKLTAFSINNPTGDFATSLSPQYIAFLSLAVAALSLFHFLIGAARQEPPNRRGNHPVLKVNFK